LNFGVGLARPRTRETPATLTAVPQAGSTASPVANFGDEGRQHVGKFSVRHKPGLLDEDAPVIQK
jgi:hypothetical protein